MTLSKISRASNSSRALPLKLSTNGFCRGNRDRCRRCRRRQTGAVADRGGDELWPLSHRMHAGAPRTRHAASSTATTSSAVIERPTLRPMFSRVNSSHIARNFGAGRPTLHRTGSPWPTPGSVAQPAARRLGPCSCRGDAASSRATAREAPHPATTVVPAYNSPPSPPGAAAPMLVCSRTADGAMRSPAASSVALPRARAPRWTPVRRPMFSHLACPSFRHAEHLAEVLDSAPTARRAQKFPREISFSISMSSAWSATIRFNRAFSSFSRRRSLASSALCRLVDWPKDERVFG